MKKKPATVFVEFPSKDNKQNVSLSQCRKSIKVSSVVTRLCSVVMVIIMYVD